MDLSIKGPKIIFELPLFDGIPITESIVNSWIAMAVIIFACWYLTRNLSVTNPSKKQIIAEKLVGLVDGQIAENMGGLWKKFAPYIGTLFAFSFCSSMLSVFALRPPTGDLSVTLALALITFGMIQFYAFKYKGLGGYFKRFAEPVVFMTPLNLLSEFTNPISMALRHFANIVAGIVITTILYAALGAFSSAILQFIGPQIAKVPVFQVGLPAVLSLYFDIFTSFIQAYIFCMLTMVFVSSTAD